MKKEGNTGVGAAEKLEVKTAFGTIVAEKSLDPDNPGIFLTLKTEDDEVTLALAEATNQSVLRVLVWSNPKNLSEEDYADSFCIMKK